MLQIRVLAVDYILSPCSSPEPVAAEVCSSASSAGRLPVVRLFGRVMGLRDVRQSPDDPPSSTDPVLGASICILVHGVRSRVDAPTPTHYSKAHSNGILTSTLATVFALLLCSLRNAREWCPRRGGAQHLGQRCATLAKCAWIAPFETRARASPSLALFPSPCVCAETHVDLSLSLIDIMPSGGLA